VAIYDMDLGGRGWYSVRLLILDENPNVANPWSFGKGYGIWVDIPKRTCLACFSAPIRR